jgi:hypothetical protein
LAGARFWDRFAERRRQSPRPPWWPTEFAGAEIAGRIGGTIGGIAASERRDITADG